MSGAHQIAKKEKKYQIAKKEEKWVVTCYPNKKVYHAEDEYELTCNVVTSKRVCFTR